MGCLAVAVLALLTVPTFGQVSTSFTYQGSLNGAAGPVDDALPMTFRLFDEPASGNQLGPAVTFPSVEVESGAFSIALDFGVQATGTTSTWLEVEVDGFTLTPRQAITASPYSLQTRGIYVDEQGDVGIGTVAPQASLDIDGADTRVKLRSTLTPATLSFRGPTVGGFGGTYSTLSFEDGGGAERFDLSHINVFGQDYLSLRPIDDATGIVQLRADGKAGVGDLPSIARLHVTDRDIGAFNDGMLNETLALEDNDAVLGIYSSNTGSFGSGIALGESVNGTVNNKWGIVRTTTNTDPELRVTYGSNTNYAQNPTSLAFVPGGIKFPDGSVQGRAAIGDTDDTSTNEVFGVGTTRYSEGIEVTVTSFAQRIMVVGFFYLQILNDNGVTYQLMYREVGSNGPWQGAAVSRQIGTRDWSSAERRIIGQTGIVSSLSPGTYEFAFRISGFVGDDTPTNFLGVDMSAVAF